MRDRILMVQPLCYGFSFKALGMLDAICYIHRMSCNRYVKSAVLALLALTSLCGCSLVTGFVAGASAATYVFLGAKK